MLAFTFSTAGFRVACLARRSAQIVKAQLMQLIEPIVGVVVILLGVASSLRLIMKGG